MDPATSYPKCLLVVGKKLTWCGTLKHKRHLGEIRTPPHVVVSGRLLWRLRQSVIHGVATFGAGELFPVAQSVSGGLRTQTQFPQCLVAAQQVVTADIKLQSDSGEQVFR